MTTQELSMTKPAIPMIKTVLRNNPPPEERFKDGDCLKPSAGGRHMLPPGDNNVYIRERTTTDTSVTGDPPRGVDLPLHPSRYLSVMIRGDLNTCSYSDIKKHVYTKTNWYIIQLSLLYHTPMVKPCLSMTKSALNMSTPALSMSKPILTIIKLTLSMIKPASGMIKTCRKYNLTCIKYD